MQSLVGSEALQKVHARNRNPILVPYLGNFSASNSTVSMPSRASTAVVYDPPGPPPTTNTVQCSGIDIMVVDTSVVLAQAKGKRLGNYIWMDRKTVDNGHFQ